MVTVRVPASSANLGPGFDCLGVALNLHLQCQGQALPPGQLRITGCPEKYQGPDNLIHRAFQHTLRQLKKPPMGVALHIESAIPLARGLGSSAAAAACGVALACALSGMPANKDFVFEHTASLEGHPDNAAAAVYGGLRAAMQDAMGTPSVALKLHPAWRFTALVPPFELSTQAARAALPSAIPHADGVFNVGRALLLTKALETGDPDLLSRTLEDRLHQPFRLKLIEGGQRVWQAAEQAGACVYLSGAGPTLMCLYQDAALHAALAKLPPKGWQALPLEADLQGLVTL